MKINEIFYSVQGEIDVGKPVIFIRTSGCNLVNCGKACKFCDSVYSWQEGKEMNNEEILEEIKKYPCKNVVVTGGEPLLQGVETYKLFVLLDDNGYNIDIETNGTLFDLDILWLCDNINCSPKKQLVKEEVLKGMTDLNVRFKFVYENKDECWWEDIIEKLEIDKERVWIMPEGQTREEQLQKSEEVIEYCKEKGFNFCPRLHVLVWNKRRAV